MLLARPVVRPAQIGLSPLIDVIFLLLIFFVVTTSFRTPELPIDLPEAAGEASKDPSALVVSIDAAGNTSIEGKPVEIESLAARLAGDGRESIVVRADGAVPHRIVVAVLDTARRTGIASVGLAVDRENAPDPDLPADRR